VNWRAVAKNDIRRATSQRGIWSLLGGFVLGFGGLAALLLYVGEPNFEGYVVLVKAGAGLLVPLAGIVLGYGAVIGARESGTAVLSLSLPLSRADILFGKLVSRTVLLVTAVVVAAVGTALGMLVTYPSFDSLQYAGLVAGVAGYGAVFLWLSVGLSMALSTARRVIAAAFGAYVGLTLFWNVLVTLTVQILFRFQPPQQPESWATFSTFIGPFTAYNYVLGEVAGIGGVPPVAATSSAGFISPAVAVLGLAGWAVLPVAAGYVSFRRIDL
jgi:ABC-type transport system involved in multi-copper enzyme maturation permease subunit